MTDSGGVFPPGLEPLEDVSAASWIEAALTRWPAGPFRVRDLVPEGFDAYGRILHRIDPGAGEPVDTWAASATARGVTLEPATSSRDLFPDGPNADETLTGSELADVLPTLRRHTRTPGSCCFCVWEGFGSLPGGSSSMLFASSAGGLAGWRERRRARRRAGIEQRRRTRAHHGFGRVGLYRHEDAGIPARAYLLFAGSIEVAVRVQREWGHAPNIWWPDDRAWLVHSEVDGYDTYVGGSRNLIAQLTASPRLECLETRPGLLAPG